MPRESVKWRRDPDKGMIDYEAEQFSYNSPTSAHGVRHTYWQNLEHLRSEGHPVHYLGVSRLDLGGPFEQQRVTVHGSFQPEWIRSIGAPHLGPWSNQYFTILMPSAAMKTLIVGLSNVEDAANATSFITPRIPNRPDVLTQDAMGAKLINMLNPTNPVADLSTSLAEFVSERKFFALPGKAGSLPGEYLNYMFGVAPTVGLVQDLRDAIDNRDKITKQYIKDSGRWVRRQYELEPMRDTTRTITTVYPTTIGPTLSTSVAELGQLTTTTKSYQKWWFSGAFTYHLPKEGTRAYTLALLDKLSGVDPSARSTAWELMPFSWIADYKASLGASIQNVESFAENRIVMPYAYVMCHTRNEVEYTWQGRVKGPSGLWTPRILTGTVTTESKLRRAANPFGFGLTATELTPKQWSILAALGLTLVRQK